MLNPLSVSLAAAAKAVLPPPSIVIDFSVFTIDYRSPLNLAGILMVSKPFGAVNLVS